MTFNDLHDDASELGLNGIGKVLEHLGSTRPATTCLTYDMDRLLSGFILIFLLYGTHLAWMCLGDSLVL
jgi:hypothetical protein